jgi:hypothetical protein
MMLAIDQFGKCYRIRGLHPRKELLALLGRKHAAKMYRDTVLPPGYVHVGYVIATLWLWLYTCEAWRKTPK